MSTIFFGIQRNIIKATVLVRLKHHGILMLIFLCTLYSSTGIIAQDQANQLPLEYSIKNADLLYLQSRTLVRKDSDSAIRLGQQLFDMSSAIDYEVGIAKAKETIARAHMHNKSVHKSIELAQDAFDYAKNIGADSIVLETINILGASHYRLKKIHKTYEYNSMGRRYAKEFGNRQKEFLFTSNAASIMADLNNFEKAIPLFEEAHEILKKYPSAFNYAQFYFEMASAYRNKGDVIAAQNYLDQSKELLSKTDLGTLKIDLLILEGNLLLDQNKIKAASAILPEMDRLLVQSNDMKSIVDLNLLKAKIEIKRQNLNAAEALINTSLPLVEQSNYMNAKESLLAFLYDIKSRQGAFEDANTVLEAYVKLKDSISFNDNQNKLKIILAENRFAQEQQILNLQLKESETQQNYILIIALFTVLTLLSILYLIKRNANSLRNLNQQLEHKTIGLNEANKTKDKLFSIIGHDLKGPITGLKQLFDMLLDKQISRQEFDSFLPKMKMKIEHILFSLNNLLSWGTTQLKGERIDPKAFELNDTLENTIKLLSDAMHTKKIELLNTVDKNINVWADDNHIEIVIRNLLSNAIKFTPEGGQIHIASEKQDEAWKVSIKDSGVGMPKDIQTQIFVENKRVSTYGTNNEAGTGLGLLISVEMIRKNKGEIWVESNMNQGTQINFTLPAARALA